MLAPLRTLVLALSVVADVGDACAYHSHQIGYRQAQVNAALAAADEQMLELHRRLVEKHSPVLVGKGQRADASDLETSQCFGVLVGCHTHLLDACRLRQFLEVKVLVRRQHD